MIFLLAISATSLAAGLLLTPWIRRQSLWCGLCDSPDGFRKVQREPIPLGGGVAVVLSTLIAIVLATLFFPYVRGLLAKNAQSLVGLGLATLVIVIIGLLDDFGKLRGRQKLAGQVLAVGILMISGLSIGKIQVFDWHIDLGWFSIPITIFWMLGAINSLNLIDGIDGLATTVGIILAGTIAVMGLMTGNAATAVIALALVGGLASFLRYNFPPAKMYLGDSGSMSIGLIAGYLAIQSSLKGPATVALAAPVAIWAIPAFDTAMAILRRKLTGRSLYTTDRGHLHHCLVHRGQTGYRPVMIIGGLCLMTAVGALMSEMTRNEALAWMSIFAVIVSLVAARVFGYVEFLLVMNHLRGFGRSLLTPSTKTTDQLVHQAQVHLQGAGSWDELWDELVRSSAELPVNSLKLDVNLPMLHQGYNASWRRYRSVEPDQLWKMEVPLVHNGRAVGRLRVSGEWDPDFSGDPLHRVGPLLREFKLQFDEVLQAALTQLPNRPSIPDPVSDNPGSSAASVTTAPNPVPALAVP